MTTLEIILIVIIWISYGVYAVYQTEIEDGSRSQDSTDWLYALIIIFAPLVLICRAIYGIFGKYEL